MSTVRYQYTVRLLSDTCCGSGTGNGSDVDLAASFDEYGLPIIPAKRLRGLLRENAFLIREKYGDGAAADLFGDSGKRSRLILDDARFCCGFADAGSIGAALIGEGFTPREVSAVFSRKRMQTAVEENTGTVQKGTLRTLETVVRGTVFRGEAEILDARLQDCEILEDAFRLLTAIGIGKSRGLGWVECRTEKIRAEMDPELPDSYEQGEQDCGMICCLQLVQDVTLMLNSTMQNPDCIPGSTLQGAFASRFAKKSYFEKLFFEDLKIGNACISDGRNLFRPAPFSLVSPKNEKTVYDLADGFVRENGKQYGSRTGYVMREGNSLFSLAPESGTDYHINLGLTNEGKKTFYNVIKLKKGQSFLGTVSGSRGALELLRSAFAQGTIRIGGSISSQYGKCTIRFGEIASCAGKNRFRKGERVIVQLVSDAVVSDPFGTVSLSAEDLIREIAGDGAIPAQDADGLDMLYLKTGTTGGWNAKWKMPRMQYRTFSRGGTVVLDCTRDMEFPDWIGIGNAEGYGQIICRHPLPPTALEVKDGKETTEKPPVPAEAEEIAEKIRRGQFREFLVRSALDDAKAAGEAFGGTLSNSAAMRLMNLLRAETRDGGSISMDQFSNGAGKYEANPELADLAEKICCRYGALLREQRVRGDDEAFTLYLRSFLGRYKEIHIEEQNRKGGEDS